MKTVKLLGQTYVIKEVDCVPTACAETGFPMYDESEAQEMDEQLFLGACAHPSQEIFIKTTDVAESVVKSTLLHEILHMVDFLLTSELSERQIRQLEVGIYGLLRENPHLITEIWGYEVCTV